MDYTVQFGDVFASMEDLLASAWMTIRDEIVEMARPDEFFANPRSERTRALLGQILPH